MKIIKLSLDALKERANSVTSDGLMSSITGGLTEECHNGSCLTDKDIKDANLTPGGI
ncbi:hypothetical protein [Flavobacterium sp.]|uniref:hypothetical protein n=1 Tax=Flavobacterium sp. TaxID=239 RepID=UPI0025BA9E71|nr:hypothetical protein [Flavobacterium sp.]